MRNISTSLLSGANTATITSSGLNTNQWVSASFQTTMGDATAAGVVKLQGSNDLTQNNSTQPTNWSDIPNATSTIAAGIGPIIVVPNMCFQWVRAVFTASVAGSTTINVQANGLSI